MGYDPATLLPRFTAAVGSSYGNLNISTTVIPARGFGGNELVISPLFAYPGLAGHLQAFAADSGAPAWSSLNPAAYGDVAVGIAGGQVTVVWNYGAFLYAVHADGSAARMNGLSLPCTPLRPAVWGTKMIYLLCSNLLVAVDPASASVAWQLGHVLADGWTTTTFNDW